MELVGIGKIGIPLNALRDLTSSRGRLMAESALLRQQLIVASRSIKRRWKSRRRKPGDLAPSIGRVGARRLLIPGSRNWPNSTCRVAAHCCVTTRYGVGRGRCLLMVPIQPRGNSQPCPMFRTPLDSLRLAITPAFSVQPGSCGAGPILCAAPFLARRAICPNATRTI